MFVPAPTEPEEAAVCLSLARKGVLYVNVCGVIAKLTPSERVLGEEVRVV